MSLNWNLTNIKNYREVCYDQDDDLNPVTEALIWSTLAVRLGSITEKNYRLFYNRFRMLEAVRGSWSHTKDGPRLMTLDEVKDHIGLSTNVTDETDLKFLRQFLYELNKGQP